MIVVGEQDVALKVPERVLQANKRGLPLLYDLKVSDNFEEVLVPIPIFVPPQRPSCIVDLRLVIEDARNQNDGDSVIRPSLAPFRE